MAFNKMVEKRILVMAGGTGGHVFPALAVARYLSNQGWQVKWLGTANRMEARLVPQYGFDIDFIDIEGVRGNGIIRKIAAPFKILRSIMQAKTVIRHFKPDVILGMGGFASGPGGVAAKLAGIPLILHEQNAIPGMTNKLLSRIASKVLCAFNGTFKGMNVQAQVVGNPIREELIALGDKPRNISPSSLKILVIGGSLGAKIFNDYMPDVMAKLSKTTSVTIWHQVGKGNQEKVKQKYQQLNQAGGVNVTDFIDDMEAAYRWADIVLCRSGALTVSELAAVGLPSILVPYPHAVDDHQTVNAKVLVDAQAAVLIAQKELDIEALYNTLQSLANDPQKLVLMGKKARSIALLDATQKVASACMALAEKGSK